MLESRSKAQKTRSTWAKYFGLVVGP